MNFYVYNDLTLQLYVVTNSTQLSMHFVILSWLIYMKKRYDKLFMLSHVMLASKDDDRGRESENVQLVINGNIYRV